MKFDPRDMFQGTRAAAAVAAEFSQDWLTAPIKTADAFTKALCISNFGYVPKDQAVLHSLYIDTLIFGRWAMSGYPTLEIGHKTAAAFMTTRIRKEDALEFAVCPWPAFAVKLPHPLLTIDYSGRPLNATMLHVSTVDHWLLPEDNKSKTPRWWFRLCAPSPLLKSDSHINPHSQYLCGVTLWGFNVPMDILADKLGPESLDDFERWDTEPPTSADTRTEQLMRALIISMCIFLGKKPGVEPSPHSSSVVVRKKPHKHRADDPLPPYELFEICSAVKTNYSEAVRKYIQTGERAAVSRHTVSPHWKMQPYGPGRAERKLIHIEEYARGELK